MNEQFSQESHENTEPKEAASGKSARKPPPAKTPKFHFIVEAENPQINVTIAPIDLKLPPPPWQSWPKPPQPDP
jgi:hypothetical protein